VRNPHCEKSNDTCRSSVCFKNDCVHYDSLSDRDKSKLNYFWLTNKESANTWIDGDGNVQREA
jgi:hypothetical protein